MQPAEYLPIRRTPIFDAIQGSLRRGLTRHDADGAAKAMQEHLEHARRFQQEYIAQEQQLDAAVAKLSC